MRYKVGIEKSEEGFSAWVPGLPGCWSEGATEEEALANIGEAIVEYLSVVEEQLTQAKTREIEVAV
jgi:predicted RNase H-like HicB family nuclease